LAGSRAPFDSGPLAVAPLFVAPLDFPLFDFAAPPFGRAALAG
jgi:hypothetical protein